MRTAYVILTDRCNLHCKYCFQEGKTVPRPESGRITREIIDAFVNFCADNDIGNAEIFGGEPMLYRELFAYAVTALRTRLPKLHIGAVTNGTMLDEPTMSLIERCGVNLLVSLDGLPVRHDAMRGGFDRVSPWFKRLAATNAVTAALQAGRTDGLYDNIRYLWDAGFRRGVFVNVIYNYDWYREDDPARFEAEYEQALLGMLRGEGILMCASRLHGQLKQAGGFQNCGITSEGLACNWDGTFYPCIRAVELGSEFGIGNIFDGIDAARDRDIRARIRDETLKSPWAHEHPLVSFCPVAVYQEHGNFTGAWNRFYCDMIETKAKLVAKHFHEITDYLKQAA
jgi:sulfatase maturation enzyme AslB (radical SAM superfamily)